MRLGHGHPDGVGDSLTEGAGGDLNTRCQMGFGVARSSRSPLPEIPEFIQGEIVSGQMQQGIKKG
jgi:hypothetical protein